MDVINLLVGINLFATITANASGAKKGLKSSLSEVIERPKTYLQKWPLNIAALVLILEAVGVFGLGVFEIPESDPFYIYRLIGLIIFIIFSWIQVWSYKTLGKNYSQEVIISKKQELVTNGPYRLIRHPQYISQLLSDLGAGLALASYLVLPIVIIVQIPLFVLRAQLEEKLLLKRFPVDYATFKKKTGFIFPFLG
ncbi:MAG: isoprenylcysteine carboxylmethyltransferase family protein [Ignavibacteriales bacterium]|jgi:protein-S-isoprenylcysteine O-methyltransferase Ste14|nr:MAG: isoprenylcysteine carboxylmethyltransferase family protein [Ignavibacteriales bacterium]